MQKVKNEGKNMPEHIEKMFEAGVHYGYSKRRRHPSVSSFIYATKDGVDIIDLEKANVMLEKAVEFMSNLGTSNKVVLFVGTKPESRDTVEKAAQALNMPYVNSRWIGGTLSNFPEIKRRINELENYNKEYSSGELEKYTKKERVVLAKKMEKLSKYYGGLLGIKKIPDVILLVDSKAEHIAATEAKKQGIKTIALANTDSNLKVIDFPILGNDSGKPSIKFIINSLVEAYKKGSMKVQ